MKVYIAGPYSRGDVILNIRAAIDAGDAVMEAGHIPFIPHLNMAWHLLHPHSDATWYKYGLAWVEHCDALLRLPGVSVGADREVEEARTCLIPIFDSVAAFLEWAK